MTLYALAENAMKMGIRDTISKGGSTQSITGASVPTDGYMVSESGGYHFDASLLGSVQGESFVYDFVFNHVGLYEEGMFLGFWIDEKSNEVWLDVSQHFSEKSDALDIAALRGELAIWDIAEAREIRLPVKSDV